MVLRWGKRAGAALIAAALGLSAAAAMDAAPRVKPPAPGPEFMSRLDYARLQTIHAAIEKKQFALAQAETKFVEDPTAKSLAQWLYIMARDESAGFAEIGAFLDAHPDWPAAERIQSFAESRIKNSDPAAAVSAFFASRAPRTGDGKVQLARARLAEGREADATALIRDAWINNNFSVAEERRILSAHKSRLRKEDHAARVDRMLWALQVTNARRTFPYLSKPDRRMAEARAALLMRAATAPRLYRNLPKVEQLDSGVLHAAVRYYRRSDQQDTAIALAANAPDTADALRNTDRWWTERRILMQWSLKEGRFADAYKLAAEHGGAEGTDFSDAEFVAGWIALRFLNEPARALTHFQAMTGAVATPISLSRGLYWLGRAADAAGDDVAAQEYYAEAATHHYSYYGQLAAEALGTGVETKTFAAPALSNPADRARFNSRPAVAALRMLADLNLDYELMVFAYHIDDMLERPGEFYELAKITNGEGAPHLTVRAGKVASQRGVFTPHVLYPTVFVPDEARAFVSPEIILGLSRQESEFNPRAYSRAGARGVMQLIPSTAQITARKEGLPYRRSALLDDPVYNMTLGSAHLSHLLDRFDGSLVMTFAAYNAGAHRATQWAEAYGDPRTGDVDPIDWVELIPFSETRNYVQRVLENAQVYRGRLNEKPIPGRLSADLERGGPNGRVASGRPPSARLAALAQSRGQAGALSDLPAQTALKAAAFREKRLAATAAIAMPPPTANEPLAAEPKRKIFRNRRSRRDAREIVTPPPAAPIQATEETAEAEPIAAPANGEPAAKTDNFVRPATPDDARPAAPTAPASPAIPQAAPAATTEPDAIAQLVESALSENNEIATTSGSLVTADDSKSEFAERIVEKAATRLQISNEGDALAAAIVRGLEQMEAETIDQASVSPDCASEEDPGDAGEPDDAAALNARMAAEFRGDPLCEE